MSVFSLFICIVVCDASYWAQKYKKYATFHNILYFFNVFSRKCLVVSWKLPIFAALFLKPERMMINHWLRTLMCTAAVAVGLSLSAQTPQCKDTVEHHRLQSAMWESATG
jgi:hypothetical protein